jgi:RNA polymerase sigma factor (sigma-70 family)
MADVAREGLASRYRDIYRFVRRRSESDAAAQDLTQQVFAEAAKSLRGRDSDDDLGLLFTIARRRLIDQLRASRPELVPLVDAEDVAAPTDYGPALARLVSEAIDRLEPGHRQIVALKLLRGLSFAEVAAIVGASEAACKMRLRRALEALRRDLREKGVRP